MIPDFTNLLTAIVSGDGAGALGTVGKKMQRKTPGLMPSQSILTDIGEGMKHAADRNTAAPMPEHTQTVQAKTPWQSTNVGKGGMGVLGNVSNTLNDMVNQPMSAPQQIDDGSYAQQVVAKYLPKYAQGGIIPAGQRGLVGDRGKHKEAQEIVDVLPDGSGAVVTPVGHYVGGLDQPAVEQNGLEQTVQGNPLTTILQNRTLEPTATLTPVDINDNNPVLQTDEIAANAKRDEIAQASVVGQNKWKDVGFGILQGVANAVAGTNKPIQTYGEVKRDRRVRQLAPQLQMLEDKVKTRQESEKAKLQNRKTIGEIKVLESRPDIMEREISNKEFQSVVNEQYKRDLITLGKEKADEIKANNLRIKAWRDRGLDQTDERIKILRDRNEELKRHNKASEGNFTTKESNIFRRQQIAIEAKNIAQQIDNAEKNKRADEANKLRLKLKDLKKEDDGLVLNASGEAVVDKQ